MPLLQVKGLVKYYAAGVVVNGVDLKVNAGEVVGLLGPNGAGKTTSFRMATGQITPNKGTVWFRDEEVTPLAMYERARLGMGYLPQEMSIFRKLNVEQNILAILEMMPKARTLGRPLTKAERYERMESAIQRFGLNKVRKTVSARLSGGEKRRLEIARCLVCEPLLILLDEPFTGIDPITIAEIRQIILELRNEGIGLLLTDHNVHEALKITTRSYLIKDGKVRTHGTPAQIVRDPIAIAEYLGQGFSDHSYRGPEDAPPARTHWLRRHSRSRSRCLPDAAYPRIPRPRAKSFRGADDSRAREDSTPGRESEGRRPGPCRRRAGEERSRRASPAVEGAGTACATHELRQLAVDVLQTILKHPIPFDAFAPEAARKTQLAAAPSCLRARPVE